VSSREYDLYFTLFNNTNEVIDFYITDFICVEQNNKHVQRPFGRFGHLLE
jgi:hypothetical protein